MRIAYIGGFDKMWDEEYIARAFESLGHDVAKIRESRNRIVMDLEEYKPDIIIWAKLRVPYPEHILQWAKNHKVPTVCWIWDLYWGYQREHFIKTNPMFKADYVITSDGGHNDKWEEVGIKHDCVRQGIYERECYLETSRTKEYDVIFVGTYNPYNFERNDMLELIEKDFDFHWFGKYNADEVRGPKLNRLFGKSKIVVGDSVYSPQYWSNRVVETLGRGGFLIHQDVPGLKEEYPYLVTYKRGDYKDLKRKIKYYLKNTKERNEIIKKNFEWVKKNHLCKHRCEQLLQCVQSLK